MRNERGFGLTEMLAVLFAGALLFASITSSLMTTTAHYHDRRIKAKADEQALMLLDMISFEVRMIGSGLPLWQEDFDVADTTLGDVPLPVLLTADEDYLQFRINEIGISTMLADDFTPDPMTLEFPVVSAAKFSVGDKIYINGATAGEKNGLQGTITQISGNSLTVNSGYVSTPATTFKTGSLVNKVSTVAFDGQSDVTRDSGSGAEVLLPRSSVAFTYLDGTGSAISLPLTRDKLKNSLSTIGVTVTVESEIPLKHGSTYTATAQAEIHLRNLRLSRE